MGLVVIWGIWSYAVALAICWALHAGIRRVGLHRARAEAEWEARVGREHRAGAGTLTSH